MANTDLSNYSATDLSKMIRSGQLDRLDLVNQLISTISADNDRLNAVTNVWPDRARKNGNPIP